MASMRETTTPDSCSQSNYFILSKRMTCEMSSCVADCELCIVVWREKESTSANNEESSCVFNSQLLSIATITSRTSTIQNGQSC